MIDFFKIATRMDKRGTVEIYPKFMIKKSSDLMIRGGDFYAIWNESKGLWSTDEQDVVHMIDAELDKYAEENREKFGNNIRVLHMWDAETRMIDHWHRYCQRDLRDSYHALDEKLIFSNDAVNKTDYASKRLNYPLIPGECPAYEKLISTLYAPEERHKIEWAIGAVVTGDSKKIQKFLVFYGEGGTGKSTILHIIEDLFRGYYASFDSKVLGSATNSFAMETLKSNPLVAIDHEGDLSRVEDNTRINSIVAHEEMAVNEKFKSTYTMKFNSFMFIGTNKPVKITDAKSGLIRRLIDVSPTGNLLKRKEYDQIKSQIPFELGAIACHCRDVYLAAPDYYDTYIPTIMLGASNDFYNFVYDYYPTFEKDDGITLNAAWKLYSEYCQEAKVTYPFPRRVFKEELRNYFREFKERHQLPNGERVRSYYLGFRTDKFEENRDKAEEEQTEEKLLIFSEGIDSVFDKECAECMAQYASENETPNYKWDKVATELADLDTHKLHYVKVPENHIVIDFDLKDADGNKSFERNLQEASKWPATYAELSKSGNGIHLHYIWDGDVTKLARLVSTDIEIKVFTGKSSLRRKLTKCNDLPIRHINTGLPLKGDDKVVTAETIKSERSLRRQIERNLRKEIHPGTKPSIDFIYKILEDAYDSGLKYDVSDMEEDVLIFASNSSHQADYCLKLVKQMKFKSLEARVNIDAPDQYVFYDVEVFPNLFLINWKYAGEDQKVVRMINPTPEEVENLFRFKLIGFNCRRYDNHMLYARAVHHFNNSEIFELSKSLINDGRGFFGEAYNLSYTDVYDFCSKKQSLKKWEIELGIHHQELGLPWDQPVPEELWIKVAEYCDNDVIATEAVFNARQADFTARQILADVAGMTVNDTTNTLTTRIIFGKERNPQNTFNYRNMGDTNQELFRSNITDEAIVYDHLGDEFTLFDKQGRPIFPGYIYKAGKSTYRGEVVGEGGYVYAEPGIYHNIALLDIASMHPHSILAEELFGPYTQRFREIVEARIRIKHKEFDIARTLLDGKLSKYLDDEKVAKDLAQALKIAINSVYGLTSAKFENPFRDIRNVDNIVAKRGALFMVNLKHEVQARGYTVAHIKTDSIKIPDATPEIIQFVMDYGKQYGYSFEHEATYDRMCLVNDAVYIAKYQNDEEHNGEWTATGTQFQVPYVFKSLFTHEPIEFNDLCETKSVTSQLYLDMNEHLSDDTMLHKQLDKYLKALNKELQIGLKTTNDILNWYMSSKDDPLLLGTWDNASEETINGIENTLSEIAKCHNYVFVGKVGQFCPILSGRGGGVLYREKDGKYYSATGCDGYRWLESETVKLLHKEDCIDISYYEKLAMAAIENISNYGDFEMFVA